MAARQKKWSEAETHTLRKAIAEGLTYEEIAERLGRSVCSVANKISDLGMTLSPVGKARAQKLARDRRRQNPRNPDQIFGSVIAHRPRGPRLPPIAPAAARELIDQFIATRGVTRCPTVYASPITNAL